MEQADDEGWDSDILAEVIAQRWDLKMGWKDQSTSWVPFSQIKESNPVQVAEYIYANKITDQLAFKWWVSKVLKKRDCIVSYLKTLCCRKGRMNGFWY